MSKKGTYKACCEEIIKICDLFPGWNIARFIKEEEIDIANAPLLHSYLKELREKLEIEPHIITDDEETEQIMRDGVNIHSLIIKQQMYGEE